MPVFAFVILHYGSADVTQRAVNSVFSLRNDGVQIKAIVVDNASPNDTGSLVQSRNAANPDFVYLKSDENLGFAKGNNVGFKYAKNELKADYIVLMNNDAVVESHDFCKMVAEDFANSEFAVLGPRIRTPDGRCQNPLRTKMLKGFRLLLTRTYVLLDYVATLLFASMLVDFALRLVRGNEQQSFDNPMDNVELHGSFLIFSPLYIQKFDGLDDRTFLYCEEEFLFARCVANGLKSRYNPEIKVLHNEVETSGASVLKKRKKRLFRLKNCWKSLKLYADMIRPNI